MASNERTHLMITFSCTHCENKFEVEDNLAGRDGWRRVCRVCKKMIIIPGPGASGLHELSLEERCDRLEKLLHFAATEADKCKGLIMALHRENARLASQAYNAHRTVDQIRDENAAASLSPDEGYENLEEDIRRLTGT